VLLSVMCVDAALFGQGGGKKAPKGDARSAFLKVELEMKEFQQAMPFKEFLTLLQERTAIGVFPIQLDTRAFKEPPWEVEVLEAEVKLPPFPRRMTVEQAVRQAIKQLPAPAALIFRGGQVEITTQDKAAREHLLNQTFFAEFDQRPLDQVLEDVCELTGVTVILDGRAKEKAKSPVTARFRNDVAAQDAVRMLAEMAELKLVHLPSGLYVTTPTHAQTFGKELRDI